MTPEDLGKLFQAFTSSAFRLETLPAYDVTEDAEREAFRLWKAGKQPPPQEREWPKLIASAVAAGKTMQRVRVVQMPLSEYQRFEFAMGYVANEQAGEEIFILDHRPPGILHEDYWLFDDELVVRLDYDDEGRFLRPVAVDDVEPYRACRDLVMVSAVPFEQYRASLLT